MKAILISMSALLCLGSSGCVAGPGGMNNTVNRTFAGVALGTLIGGVAGKATGNVASGLVLGAIAGGAGGALINPNGFGHRAERDCYTTDAQGRPIVLVTDEAGCALANGRMKLPPVQSAGR